MDHPYTVDLAGTTYEGRQEFLAEALAAIEAGAEPVATLVREPHNQHDQNAVRVDVDGRPAGYVPRFLAARIAPLMDAGEEIAVTSLRILNRLVITHGVGAPRYVATVTIDSAPHKEVV